MPPSKTRGIPVALERLCRVLEKIGSPAIAVSGGVDSITLAYVAGNVAECEAEIFHAISPAVPAAATARVKDHARRFGWKLTIIEAGEFSDPRYLNNPLNRCYFCKSSLYQRIARHTAAEICSGANLDDLGDYRPGLIAAKEARVRHPFLEAEISKEDIRAIARNYGLNDVFDLPAQPCLASRVETGIAIDAGDLALVEEIEALLSSRLGQGDIRCRITAKGVRLELPQARLERLEKQDRDALINEIARRCKEAGKPLQGHGAYEKGSAFLQGQP